MWAKRKKLIIATAVVGLLAAAAPALEAVAGETSSPFGQGNPLDNLQGQVDRLNSQINAPTPRTLTGDYAWFANLDCMFKPESGTPFTQHMTISGTVHYNGNGTATENINGMLVSNITSQFPVGTFTSTCPLTYAVNADGSFTQTRTGCTSTNGDGSTTTVSGNVQLQGRISNGGRMLLLAGITPNIEALANSNSPNVTNHRVCTRSIVATKIN
jgi:hypothetical protein